MNKAFLIILDGFGIGKHSPFNAIQHAKMPFYKSLLKNYPHSQLETSGEAVGLPVGVMGNSEVGHMNIGAGRIVYQELTRINKAIRENEFEKNPQINSAISTAQKSNSRLHLMGLLSDAGVHSHISHLKALIKHAYNKVPMTIHIFTDGRDTPPTSAVKYVKELGDFLRQYPEVSIGSISGRYFAMDRDNRWDRIEKAWKALTGQSESYSYKKGNGIGAALKILEESYKKEITDEFILPTFIETEVGTSKIQEKDVVVFYNFRADRARELTRTFTEDGFKGFDIKNRPKLSMFLCLTQYDKNFPLPVAFSPQNLIKIFPEIISEKKLTQFRIAETEKYAHVTFFFNGGKEDPFEGENRKLIPSPKDVATYDLKPEMSAHEVTQCLSSALQKNIYDFVLVNYANPDMVGHTGKYAAAVQALQTVDECLENTIKHALQSDYHILITADHGNIEEMQDEEGHPHTQHTLNPVPLHLISKNNSYKLKDGILADVAPTLLEILNISQPSEMTGTSLLKK